MPPVRRNPHRPSPPAPLARALDLAAAQVASRADPARAVRRSSWAASRSARVTSTAYAAQVPDLVGEHGDAPLTRRCAGRCAGPPTAARSTSPSPRCCSPPAARRWTNCWPRRPRSATPGSPPPADPAVVTYSRKVFIPLTRLCRDRCHYCTFVTVPSKLPAPYLDRDEVLAIARAGAAQGCKEALFTLGDRPEDRWPQAKQWLEERGYASTVDYLRACAIAVLEETGLLPHLNPGVLSWSELQRLRPVAPSMGMMLETTAERLWSTPGEAHYGSPDKEPRYGCGCWRTPAGSASRSPPGS